jgi:hypothetical protein
VPALRCCSIRYCVSVTRFIAVLPDGARPDYPPGRAAVHQFAHI